MAKQMSEKVAEQWERLKVLVASAEDDVLKNAHGNVSAGVRARKALRLLRTEMSALIKLTITESKKKKEVLPEPPATT